VLAGAASLLLVAGAATAVVVTTSNSESGGQVVAASPTPHVPKAVEQRVVKATGQALDREAKPVSGNAAVLGTGPNDVRVGGSVEVAPLTETAYALFRTQEKNVRVSVDAVDTTDGYDRLCRGELDISGASYAKPTGGACSSKVAVFEVGHHTLPIVVDKSNTWAQCLTLEQLHSIWVKGSTISSWKQVDRSFPDVPLTLYGPQTTSISSAFFNAAVNGSRANGRTNYVQAADSNLTAQSVATTRGSLGFLDYPTFASHTDQLRGLKVDSGSGCIYPTLQAARTGQYIPLCKPLFVYVRLAALKRPAVAEFARFYLTQGERIAEQAHYVPRDTAEIQASISKINELTKGVGPVRPISG
jgi:phosphate binding protein